MLNLIKADVYRMLHQKSFYITLGLEVVFYFMILWADGFQSNTAYATFDHRVNSIVDFFYYLPKSSVFVTGLLLYGGLFYAETYSSKCSSTIYPVYTKKYQIVFAQWFVSFMIYLMPLVAILMMSFISSFFLPNAFGSLSLIDYIIYAFVQGCFFAAMMSLVGMVSHILRNTTITVIFSICLGVGLLLIVYMGAIVFLKLDVVLVQYSLYVSYGTLPYVFTLNGYITPVIICIGATIASQIISILCLQKRDLN